MKSLSVNDWFAHPAIEIHIFYEDTEQPPC